MLKITLEFPIEPIFTHPTRSGLRGHAYKFHQQGCFTHRHHYAFSIRGDPFWNILPAEIVNTPTQTGSPCSHKDPSYNSSPLPTLHPPLTWSFIVVLTTHYI